MKSGFTLIELLIGIALIAVLLGTANAMLYSSLQGARKAEAVGVTKAEGALAIAAMMDKIKYSRRWTACTGSSLRIERLNGDTITYSLSGTKLASAGATTTGLTANADLTSAQVTVAGCGGSVFSCPNASEVDMCFVVTKAGVTDVRDSSRVTFDSTVNIRNVDN